MCGRYTLSGNLAEIRACFKAEESLTEDWNWSPRYNISPGMVVPAVAFDGEKRRKVVPMRWGFIHIGAKSRQRGALYLMRGWKQPPKKPVFARRFAAAAR